MLNFKKTVKLIVLDQLFKLIAQYINDIVIIKNVISLGIWCNPKMKLYSSVVLLIFIIFLNIYIKKVKEYRIFLYESRLIFAGVFSNFIDKICRGFVIDWLIINNSIIINLADIYIIIGITSIACKIFIKPIYKFIIQHFFPSHNIE